MTSPNAPRGIAGPRPVGVLVIDDALEVRQMLAGDLQQQGFTVWQAANGQQALEVYREKREDIDTVLLEVCMPGLDGPQTLAALRQQDARIRCCFMTFGCDKYTEEELLQLGADRVLRKPFHLFQAARVLRELAEQS